MEWMLMPLRRYAEFSGRSRRKEYWMFFLFVLIVSIVLGWLDSALGLGGSSSSSLATGEKMGGAFAYNAGVLGTIFSLATLIPGIAVAVRRLHDTDRSGWWLLIVFTIIGAVVLMVFFLLDGTRGPNRFGPDPKEPAPEGVF